MRKPLEKQIQLPEEVFWDGLKVCYFALNDEIRAYLNENDLKVVERFQRALESKLDKMVLHDLYSKSKDTNLTDKERERARQEYLDRKGVHTNFRY